MACKLQIFWSIVISTRYSRDEWSALLEEYGQSDLSVQEFCDLSEVSVATFYNWQRKLRKQAQNEIDHNENAGSIIETSFSEVFLSNCRLNDTVEINLPAGATVKLPNDPGSLRPILQVLAEIVSRP